MSASASNRPDRVYSSLGSLGAEFDLHARRLAHQERRLLTLLELGREATETLDESNLCSLGLLTLMGYLGTARAALWACADDPAAAPRMADSHGLQPPVLEAITQGLPSYGVRVHAGRAPTVVLPEEFGEHLDDVTAARLRASDVTALCALVGAGEVVGFVVLGRPVGDADPPPIDRGVLDAACGMLGVSIVNTRLIARLQARGEELARANRELAELDRLKSNFLSNINHELRTPIAVIQGAASCLRLPGLGEKEVERFRGMIESSASRLIAMVQTLLDFSSLNTQSAELALADVDLGDVAGTYLRGRRQKLEQSGRHCTYLEPPTAVVGRGNEQRIFDILDRLVDNAVRFAPAGSHVAITATWEEDAHGRRAVLAVADDGPGIEPDKLRRIFEPFEQADGSATRTYGGLGLGLAVARRHAEAMGGTLTVESAVGSGSKFFLRLPPA